MPASKLFRAVLLSLAVAATAAVTVGDTFPAIDLDFGFPPEKVSMTERLANKKTILVGLPGAFTPT